MIPGNGIQDASCTASLGSDPASSDEGVKSSEEMAPIKVTSGNWSITFGHVANRIDRQLNEEERITDGYIYKRSKGKCTNINSSGVGEIFTEKTKM